MRKVVKKRFLWIGGILGFVGIVAFVALYVLLGRSTERLLDAETAVFAEGFEEPAAIATTAKGHVLVTDAGRGEVVVLDAEGRRIRTFGKDLLRYPVGIAVDPTDGSIWVSDSEEDRIHRFDPEGKHVASFGTIGEGVGEFSGAVPRR